MRRWEVVARLDADKHERSGRVHRFQDLGGLGAPSDELFIKFPESGCMWVKTDGRHASGWTYHGTHTWRHFGLFDRLRIRAAVRRWLARNEQPQEPV